MAKKKVFSIGTALSRGLEETIESAQSYSGELRIDVIPLSKIELDPSNPRDLSLTPSDVTTGINPTDSERTRKETELDSLRSIAHSIKTQGIINPITVYKFGEKYRLIAGERRTLGSLLAGKSDIQAKILDDKPDPLKISLLQWIENIERADLSLAERLSNLEKIVEAYVRANNHLKGAKDISITELSQLLGCVKSHAMSYKALLSIDDELRQLIIENKINSLKKVALITEITTKTVKQEAISACLAGATFEQLKVLAAKRPSPIASLKTVERRGRQSKAVNFGTTKSMAVAKMVVEALLQTKALANLTSSRTCMDFNDPREVSQTFKQILKALEKQYN